MSILSLPALLIDQIHELGALLDRRIRPRFWSVFFGLILCREKRRTASAWFRAAAIGDDFHQAYETIGSVGRRAASLAIWMMSFVERSAAAADDERLVFALDDTPTKRYGPAVQGAGVHHNPTPGPAGQKYVYGHVWVTLARVVKHACWGTIALPVRSELYVREKNLPVIPGEYGWEFRTKLQQAAQLIGWLRVWLAAKSKPIWLLMDGAYAKRPVLRAAKQAGVFVVSRLRHDAALRTVPDPAGRPKNKRGRKPVYGDRRISLAKRAAARGGWTTEEVEVYGRREEKTFKTFLATWGPAGGVIRVALVKQERNEWVAYFTTNTETTASEILGLVSDRAAIEQVFHDVKEIWGAGQQQLRNIHANIGAWHLNLWAHTLTELWAWDKPEEELVDRSASPWDAQWRRPSHGDRRKAMLRETLRSEIQAAASGEGQTEKLKALAERLLLLAA
jgi:hypothetical protein